MFSRIIKRPTKKSSRSESSTAGVLDAASQGGTTAPSTAKNAGGALSARSSSTANVHGSTATAPSQLRASAKSSSSAPNGGSISFAEPLPSFRDVLGSEKQALFVKKLNLCCVTFDFTNPNKDVKEKEMKRQTLLELVEYVASGAGKITEAVIEDFFKMISINLFRTLPSSGHESSPSEALDPEEEEPSMEPTWPHLQLVYDFLMRYVNSPDIDIKLAKRYIDHSFLLHLLDLFDSEDARERDSLKTILHRIYGKFMVHRPFIRKAINNMFYHFIFESERHNGIGELLEILGSIINGFALPLKEEHKLFLVRALIPLHKPRCVVVYHQQLAYCITQFVEKDFKLADTVIRGILKYWPITNSQKEVLFLGEVEEVLEATEPAEFQRCMIPLFKQIGRCLNSSHFQVAERALFLWNNDHIVSLVAQNREAILPLIFGALEKNSSHWNLAVNGLTSNVRKMFIELDYELFCECEKKYKEIELKSKVIEDQREWMWKNLESITSLGADLAL